MSKWTEARYDEFGKTSQREGFNGKMLDYIAWPDAVRQVYNIFGHENVIEIAVVDFQVNGTVFTATGRIVVKDEAGVVHTFQNTSTTVAKPNRQGEITPAAIEMAADGASSGAIVRATKFAGDAFGLYLYDKDEDAAPAQKVYAAGNVTPIKSYTMTNPTGGASQKQIDYAIALGADPTEAAGMSKADISAYIEANKGKGKPRKVSAPAHDFPFAE